jgi:hypothetical protein
LVGDGFLLRGDRNIHFSICGPSKNPVLVGNGINASAQGIVGMTLMGWQSVTLSMKEFGGRHGWGTGRHYLPTTRLRHAQKSGKDTSGGNGARSTFFTEGTIFSKSKLLECAQTFNGVLLFIVTMKL